MAGGSWLFAQLGQPLVAFGDWKKRYMSVGKAKILNIQFWVWMDGLTDECVQRSQNFISFNFQSVLQSRLWICLQNL